MQNIVTAIFDVESEAYKAFVELRNMPFGPGYTVAEAALVKSENGNITVADSFDAAGVAADDTATGMVVGSLVGILGGPLGVLLGASVGGLAGTVLDVNDAEDSISMLEVTAGKLADSDSAIIALVDEDEPAFDAHFIGYDVIVIRQFATDVYDEVERARDLEVVLANQAKAELRAEKKAERKALRESQKAAIDERIAAAKAKRAEKKAERKAREEAERKELEDAMELSSAEFVSSTQEMLGTKKEN